MKTSWGYHLILDLARCNPKAIRNYKTIQDFSKRLVHDIDMVPFGPPLIQRFGDGNKMGYTLVQLIETSNITAHFCEESNDAYIDVFSCKKFCGQDVSKLVKEVFEPAKMRTRMVLRNSPQLR
jgi:S-adenosylmethionine/arginine decarboxylase-like enzyme